MRFDMVTHMKVKPYVLYSEHLAVSDNKVGFLQVNQDSCDIPYMKPLPHYVVAICMFKGWL